MKRRPFMPASYIGPDTEASLLSLPIYPWDVLPAPAFLAALGVGDRMLVNRWLYRGADQTPPFEPQGRWAVGQGAPRVIRKDRAVAWARSGGKAFSGRDCWPLAAEALNEIGWPALAGPEQVQSTLDFLLTAGIIPLAIPPRHRAELAQLYVS